MGEKVQPLREILFNQDSVAASKQDRELLFDQYKLYVEIMDKVSERRYQANSFFLTVNSGLITIIAGLFSLVNQTQSSIQNIWMVLPTMVGIILCITWKRLITSYGQLNSGKFKIIHMLESRLPARLFEAEWEVLNEGDGKLYTPFTNIESLIPLIFIGLYIVISLLVIWGKLV